MNDLIMIEAGRGCPYACTFCSTSVFWGRQFRIKPAVSIIDEMNRFNKLYGVTRFSLLHDLFTANKSYLEEFCLLLIKEGINYDWDCSSRIDVLDKETIDLLAESKCKGMFIGLETGSFRMQKLINKNIDLEKAVNLIEYINSRGIELTVAFIYGYPDETEQDFLLTVEMMERLRRIGVREIQLGTYIPLPRTLEAEKIKDRMYFDEEDINFSIYKKYVFDDNTKALINRYPELFIQYYCFESTVRKKYRYFDIFHAMFMTANSVFYCCTNYLLDKYRWIEIYEKYAKRIEGHVKMRGGEPRESKQFLEESCLFFDTIIKDELYYNSGFLRIAYSIEKLFFSYCMGNEVERISYRVRVDYFNMRKHKKVKEKEVKLIFSKESNHPQIMQLDI